jgi:hypothetical protein
LAGGERINACQLRQGFVQRQQAFIRVGRRDAVERHPASVAATLEAACGSPCSMADRICVTSVIGSSCPRKLSY